MSKWSEDTLAAMIWCCLGLIYLVVLAAGKIRRRGPVRFTVTNIKSELITPDDEPAGS